MAVRRSSSPGPPHEATEIHTRVLRLALGVEESRAYWEHIDGLPAIRRASVAFEERWFGGKSLERVRFLLAAFGQRFDAFPDSAAALRRLVRADPVTRQQVCHFHVQLSDPIYRAFTGDALVKRRELPNANMDRDVVLRWLRDEHHERWAAATEVQFASKLLSAASEAGLIAGKKESRTVALPRVSDLALAYIFYSLRTIRFDGSLLENPYLRSLGLTQGFLEQRLRGLPGMTFRRMGELVDFEWQYPDLTAWAEATL